MNDMEALGEALALIKCISECSMLQEAHERSRKIERDEVIDELAPRKN